MAIKKVSKKTTKKIVSRKGAKNTDKKTSVSSVQSVAKKKKTSAKSVSSVAKKLARKDAKSAEINTTVAKKKKTSVSSVKSVAKKFARKDAESAESAEKKATTKKMVAKKSDTKSEYTMYHKPNCSTSRNVLEYLNKKKIKPEIIKYIETPPTEKELEKLLAKLHIKPFDLIRQKEKYFQEKLKGLKLNDHEWIKEMVENPVLIERPIIIKGNKAIIGRPIEKVIDFI